MHLLKEAVHKTTLQSDPATAFVSLRSKLAELHIHVEKEDKDRGEIVARCLTSAVNTILWRCWSDKLLFKVKGIDATKTKICVYAVPNLLRFQVEQSEKTIELKELVSRLFT
jgi:hypothetical protein